MEDVKEHLKQYTPEEKKPTDERLKMEAAEIANVMHAVWDGEVEVVVALVRKADLRVSWATSIGKRDRLKAVLEEIKDSSRVMSMLITGNKQVR